MTQRVYIVDDEPKLGNLFVNVLKRDGFEAESFVRPGALLEQIDEGDEAPDAVFADLMMPEMNGIELLEELRERNLRVPVIIITAHSCVQTAVEAMRLGAFHYLQKPVNLEEMRSLLKKALQLYEEGGEEEALAPEKSSPGKKAEHEYPVEDILGESESIVEVRQTIQMLRDVPNTIVLISGETGTGKNLVARTIHHNSDYNAGRFMEINCAALPDNLLEAELFGYEKGAFTDARDSKPGLLELADGGTVFLDEIDSMSMALQAKLLSFLESRTFRRLGGVEEIRVTTRILCATNADLDRLVAEQEFRKDLYFRINVVNLHLPPLRQMGEDVLAIARSLLENYTANLGKEVKGFTEAAREKLMGHHWQGNVRELRNVLERAVIFCEGALLDADDLVLVDTPGEFSTNGVGGFNFRSGATLEEVERAYIKHVLSTNDMTYAQISEMLGISKKTLWEKRKRYNLDEELAES